MGDPGGGCAIKVEGVCRLGLPGVRMCLPFEEGILHVWRVGWVSMHWVGVEGGGFNNCRRWGARS